MKANSLPAESVNQAVDSDHNTLYMDLNLEEINEKKERIVIFNFKKEPEICHRSSVTYFGL